MARYTIHVHVNQVHHSAIAVREKLLTYPCLPTVHCLGVGLGLGCGLENENEIKGIANLGL